MGIFGNSKLKLFVGSQKIKKAYLGTEKIYSAGNIVTYVVDTDKTYTEEVDSDANCLNPTAFTTPAKDGWEFVGWKEDTTASGDILTNKVMGDEPITLYAVFKQDITLTYNGNDSTSGSVSPQSGTRYYNASGSTSNPSFTLASNGYSRTDYTFIGWDLGIIDDIITLDSDTTAYAQWVANPFYAIQNGAVNRTYAPNASAWSGGYSNASGTITNDGITYYGGNGHTTEEYEDWGADTGNITTNGLQKLYIQPYMNNWSFGSTGNLTVYGNGAVIYSAEIPMDSLNGWNTTLDIAGYDNIRVYINSPNGGDHWVNCGLITVYLHN